MDAITSYLRELEQMIEAISLPRLQAVLLLLEEAYHHGRRIFIMGNGGSNELNSFSTLKRATLRFDFSQKEYLESVSGLAICNIG